jgi:chemotaxis protein MotB
MMKYFIRLLTIVLFGQMLTSCVSSKQYDILSNELAEANNRMSRLAFENDSLRDRLTQQVVQGVLQEEIIEDQSSYIGDLSDSLESSTVELKEVRNEIAKAMVPYQADSLEFFIRNNKIYFDLPDWILFSSGSVVLSPKSKTIIKQVGEIISRNDNLQVTIEGHTDNEPVQGTYEDNWELSIERSLAVARAMLEQTSVNKKQIIVSGRGDSFPLASNETASGKAINRRIVLIIEPAVGELVDIVQEY